MLSGSSHPLTRVWSLLQRKAELMRKLLEPVIRDFGDVYSKLCAETDETRQQAYAECLNCAMSFAG